MHDLSRDQLEHRVREAEHRSHELEKLAVDTAKNADFQSTKIPFHFKFRPDTEASKIIPEAYGGQGNLPTVSEDIPLSYNLYGEGVLHKLLIGDNIHALAGLCVSAAESGDTQGVYDIIYIDPPYNTGRDDMMYDDRFAKETDLWFRTDWASFMDTRLRIARTLIAPEGVIMVAIGHHEHARLRMLMDHIFGENNLVATLHWAADNKNDASLVSNSVDYTLVYAKSKAHLEALGTTWRSRDDELVTRYFAEAKKVWDASTLTDIEARREEARTKFAAQVKKAFSSAPDTLRTFNRFDERGRLYSSDGGNVSKPKAGKGHHYDLRHPVTGGVCPTPPRGYRYPLESMMELVDKGLIEFGKDHTTQVKKRRFKYDGDVVPSFIKQTRRVATKHVSNILGPKGFDHPKDHHVLASWFNTIGGKDAKILDFFGGSGTTAEAVLLLNAKDGGTREVTVVTNDARIPNTELHIGTDVTRERIVRVMSGHGWHDESVAKAHGGRLAVFRVGAQKCGSPYVEEEYHSWSRSAALWSVMNTSPVVVRDTSNTLVTQSAAGNTVTLAVYGTQVTDDEVNILEDEFPEATWYGIFYSNVHLGEWYPYVERDVHYATGERDGEVLFRTEHREVKMLPAPAMEVVTGVVGNAVRERSAPSHTVVVQRKLNLLNGSQ